MVSPAAVAFMERNNREVRHSNPVPSPAVSQCGSLSARLAPLCIRLSPGTRASVPPLRSSSSCTVVSMLSTCLLFLDEPN